jgi:ribosome-binding factor A
MNPKKPSSEELLKACAEVGPDDGLDPRDLLREPKPRVPNRKALQLCGQVARTLDGVLRTCGDDVLRDLTVVSVVPAPNAGRLLVTLTGPVEAAVALEHVRRAAGLLRSEVAAVIHRRRAPELTFRLTGAS